MRKHGERRSSLSSGDDGPSPKLISLVSALVSLVIPVIAIPIFWVIARKQGVQDVWGYVSNRNGVIGPIAALASAILIGLAAYFGPVIYKWYRRRSALGEISNRLRFFRTGDVPLLAGSLKSVLSHFSDNRKESLPNTAQVVEKLLELRLAIKPVADGVGALSKQDAMRCGQSIGTVAKAWAEVLKKVQVHDELETRLLLAFLNAYAEEEARDIKGERRGAKGNGTVPSDGNFVVTNFVAYSEFVQAMIHEARSFEANVDLICRTALVLPLTRWFNFRYRPDKDMPYCEINEDWEKYIRFQADLLAGREQIQVQRILVAVNDECIELLNKHGLGFHTAECIRKHAKSWILVPESLRFNELKAFSRSDRKLMFHEFADSTVRTLVEKIYDTGTSYVILPPTGATEDLAAPEGYLWREVWEIFKRSFHSRPEDVKYLSLSRANLEDEFINPSAGKIAMPEDFFLLGKRIKGDPDAEPDWFFCLGADVDPDVNRLTLHFMTPHLSGSRFTNIKRYAGRIWKDGAILDRVFETPLAAKR